MDNLIQNLNDRANALAQTKNPTKAIDDIAVHLGLAAEQLKRLQLAINNAYALLKAGKPIPAAVILSEATDMSDQKAKSNE